MHPGSGGRSDPSPDSHGTPQSASGGWGVLALALAGWLAYVLTLEIRNPRLVASWHGLLHTAITMRFPSRSWIPENPFFAGEPLRYYWLFHRAASGLGRLLGLDPLSALRLLTLIGLVILVVAAFLSGRRVCRSAGAGLLVGYLALVGLNPLGPGLAGARHVTRGVTLLEKEEGAPQVETVFTTNDAADRFMARNLLGAMYLSTDWRHGQNISWFFDISSRGLALGAAMMLIALVTASRASAGYWLLTALTTGLLAALNPIVGLAAGGALGFSLLVTLLAGTRAGRDWAIRFGWRRVIMLALALAAGAIIAVPTFYHLFTSGGSGAAINPPGVIGLKIVNMGFNFIVLLPLALLALRIDLGEYTLPLRAIVLTGVLLLLVMLTIHLEEGNEHNLTNAAQVFLALPAVAFLAFQRDGSERRNRGSIFALVFASFVPVTAGTWVAFDGRPALPFSASAGHLERTPGEDPLAALYTWIQRSTRRAAIFVVDPSEPVKMSGNVSELPAFTGRVLFTDQPSYLTTPYPDSDRRAALAKSMVQGNLLSEQDAAYLWRLSHASGGERAIYVATWHADQAALLTRLTGQYGAPVFHQSSIALFLWRPRAAIPGSAIATPTTRP